MPAVKLVLQGACMLHDHELGYQQFPGVPREGEVIRFHNPTHLHKVVGIIWDTETSTVEVRFQ